MNLKLIYILTSNYINKIIAKLINKGFRFIISTHSDYIIREFNNLVMLSNDKLKKEAEKI